MAAEELTAVPVRRPGRWVASAVVLVLVAMLVHTLAFSHVRRGGSLQPRFQWGIVGHYFTSSSVLAGLLVTLELTALAMLIGVVLGIVLAVMRLSTNPIVSGAASLYVWFFRGTPVFVQILFWYNIAYILPRLSFGIPFGPSFVSVNMVTLLTPFLVGVAGLGLNEAAYMAEIVRAGLLSVDYGQTEAAQSLGLRRLPTLRRIVLPQALRVIVPVTGNETISMLKTSSLASVATVTELLYSVELIYARTYQTVPLLIVASLWYLLVTTILTIGQYFIERHYARGSSRQAPAGFVERLVLNLRRNRTGRAVSGLGGPAASAPGRSRGA